ncbi:MULTISPECIES: hypothetical protein [unclassified Sporolactobacillus]|uniref:hypothetical protein n=1 Tax=unclassified Sporolactobacillus TaxID=2628533 RepID=UPI0023682EFE|nr:hypothetical protein [Sporolactobacillus sp. CQH2019]MDD9148328.1 hypothetical protein [Sporolactobacillus sp. CQH2019]
MAAWTALLKKEMRLGGPGFLIFLISQAAVMALGIYLAYRSGSRTAMAVTGLILIGFHFLYLFGYMVVNVSMEKKTFHLWLHNPLPGWSLLAAKLVSGIIYMTFSLLVIGIYTWIGYLMSGPIPLSHGMHIYRTGILVIAYIYWIAIYIGIVFIFLWLVFLCLRSRMGRAAWAIMIAGMGAAVFLLVKLTQYGIFAAITEWGKLPTGFVDYWISSGVHVYSDPVYLGSYVLDLFVMALFFALSAWLMDHRLEMF